MTRRDWNLDATEKKVPNRKEIETSGNFQPESQRFRFSHGFRLLDNLQATVE
jgi:hypothetical protein